MEKLDGEEEDVHSDWSPKEMKESRKRKRAAHMFITSCEKGKKKKWTKNLSSRWSKEVSNSWSEHVEDIEGERNGVWEADIAAGVEIEDEETDWRYRSIGSFVETHGGEGNTKGTREVELRILIGFHRLVGALVIIRFRILSVPWSSSCSKKSWLKWKGYYGL
ncbi:hypothetical protein Pint_17166 [Pistacia integerrima]|uniref:Uncharacterized protein n=1 Tax=Pistacia integerrima TaxID=434235 RepID=A0ACC0YYK5_9ROSI|nr:hypothetical protein Pint_17166 [Pistacia integerrima]